MFQRKKSLCFFHKLVLYIDFIILRFIFNSKDYTTGKLNSGLLQLAPHTHLVLDETKLEAGKLENHGIQSVKQIAHLIGNQQLNVDFKFYTIDYNVNIPVLILSEGRSMLPVSYIILVFRWNFFFC